jgi:hypothetical protein
MDLHISVIGDFKSLGLDVEVTDWCMSGHACVMKRPMDAPKHINAHDWKHLTPQKIESFHAEYDSFLSTFDCFVVAYASSFAMVFEKYRKPIIMINACRYDLPFCWTRDMEGLARYKECLRRLNTNGLLFPVSNNLADQWYTLTCTGVQTRYIPSLCLYTGIRYAPTRPTFLCYHGTLPDHPLVTPKKDIGVFDWSLLGEFKGIIHFPYEVSTMSMFEHFSGGLPMFFPSKDYLKANPALQTIAAYWTPLPPGMEDLGNLSDWIDLADFYHVFKSPNTYYFDSIPHLFELLESFEYTPEGDFRTKHIESVKAQWRQLLAEVQTLKIRTQSPQHLCYNRLPLLAQSAYDINYNGSGVVAQHIYPYRYPSALGDCVFVKTDYLDWFLGAREIKTPITLITGVSDFSPSDSACDMIIANPNVKRWIGCNITVSHPKIYKIPIGVGEPERHNGNHEELLRLHASRMSWDDKSDAVCIPYHGTTHGSRTLEPTLPSLPFAEYMTEIGKHKFVVSMRGNGLDTHRVCEILLMGSVPVILHSGLDDMYERFPCLLVESFDQIDTSGFVWDPVKYEQFLDIFWMRLRDLQAFLSK